MTIPQSGERPVLSNRAEWWILLLPVVYILSEPWIPAILMSISPSLFEFVYPALLVAYAPFDLLLQSETFQRFYEWYVFRLAEWLPRLFG